ncbi:DUF2339 domain-containing protein [Paenibacillus aceris]|uniref:Membrane protein n=1 Tax=Paenibacillus aceris TaxID=869555 RepID=A0ABS4HYC8_9BACL|nr:DUF2339 domain-containing protein [Paenibacillus aceris]MBP1963627.1 putative membrane protein [Paenibacillus aceris]NHW36889.1 DUF2339 domain-containing protein [Paenibacillus aceris]
MDLELRVAALEKKVKELEQLLDHALDRKKASESQLSDWPPPEAERSQPSPPHRDTKPKLPTPAPPRDWEHLIARIWLPRIFIIVFLLGVLWGFTAAVSAGIITEPVRCILGIAAAGLMYWQGEAQMRRTRTALGQVLLGGASGVLMLSLFAAHMLFELLPSLLAFVLYILSIAVSVFTAIRHRSQALMIITLLAGYLVPFMVDSAHPNIWIFAGYEGLFSMAMMLLSLRYSFRGAYYTAFGVLHLPLLISTLFTHDANDRPALLTIVVLQHLLLFGIGLLRSEDSRIGQRITLFLSFGLLAAWTYGLYGTSSGDRHLYEWMLALWSILYLGTSFLLYRQKRAFYVQLSIATFSIFLWLIYILHADQAGSALLVEGGIALYLGIRFHSRMQQISGALTYFIGMLFVFAHPIHHIGSNESFGWLVLVATICGLYAVFRSSARKGIVSVQFPLLLLWMAFILLLIYVSQLTNVLTNGLGVGYQHLILSGVWAVYAVLLIIAGLFVRRAKARLIGILFLFVTLLKIIFIDLPDVSTAIRAILFIGLGAIGVGISRLFYKRKETKDC